MIIILGSIIVLFLPVTMVFFIKNSTKWADETFDERYGALLDGLFKDKRASIAFYVIFTLRRFIFTILAIFAAEYLFVQIFSLLLTSYIQIVYLLVWRPFEDPFMNKMEIFNETSTILLSYFLFLFSPANVNMKEGDFTSDLVFTVIIA